MNMFGNSALLNPVHSEEYEINYLMEKTRIDYLVQFDCRQNKSLYLTRNEQPYSRSTQKGLSLNSHFFPVSHTTSLLPLLIPCSHFNVTVVPDRIAVPLAIGSTSPQSLGYAVQGPEIKLFFIYCHHTLDFCYY